MNIPNDEKIVLRVVDNFDTKNTLFIITEKLTVNGREYTRYNFVDSEYQFVGKSDNPLNLEDDDE